VEALLQEEFEGVRPSDFDHTTAQVAKAVALIQESDLAEAFKPRAVGSISGLRHVRAKDKLKLLVQSAVVPRDLMEAWDRLRQPAAHGQRPPGDRDSYFADCVAVLSLFYRLAFELVGYKGTFVNYSQAGWPTGYLPPEAPETPANERH
jgi:hypothetical protein